MDRTYTATTLKERILRSALAYDKHPSEIWEEVKQSESKMSRKRVEKMIERYTEDDTQYADITVKYYRDELWGSLGHMKLSKGIPFTSRVKIQNAIHSNIGIFFDVESIRKVGREYEEFLKHRMDFVEGALSRKETFEDVVFAESCTLRLWVDDEVTLTPTQKEKLEDGVVRFPCQVSVWAGISTKGATEVYVYQGRDTRKGYVNILKEFLVPFGNKCYPEGYRLMQEDNKIRSSKTVSDYMEKNGIVWEKLPAESKDLCPLQRVWVELENYVNCAYRPAGTVDLEEAVKTFWEEKMTPERCQMFISQLPETLSRIVETQGVSIWDGEILPRLTAPWLAARWAREFTNLNY